MQIFDISQEVFSCAVFPGDPAPKREILSAVKDGDACNLTAFSMCAHNGTHIDAPFHFLDGGKRVDGLPLSKLVGFAYVTHRDGVIKKQDISDIIASAKQAHRSALTIMTPHSPIFKSCRMVNSPLWLFLKIQLNTDIRL